MGERILCPKGSPAQAEANFSYQIKSLSEVLNYSPFTSQGKEICTFCDLDGVVLHPSLKKGVNFSSLRAFAQVAQRSEELVIWSLRMAVSDKNLLFCLLGGRSLSCLPIMSSSSQERLIAFFNRVAPETKISFSLGIGKLDGKALLGGIEERIKFSSCRIAVIGSNFLDRWAFYQSLNSLPLKEQQRLTYFETGSII